MFSCYHEIVLIRGEKCNNKVTNGVISRHLRKGQSKILCFPLCFYTGVSFWEYFSYEKEIQRTTQDMGSH